MRPRQKRADGERSARTSSRVPLTYYRQGAADDSRSPFDKSQPKIRKWHKFFIRFVDVLIIAVILFCLIYSLIVQPDPKLNVSSTKYHSSDTYRDVAIKQLRQLKNRTKISLDEKGIINVLQKQFPEITGATIELPLFSEKPRLHLNIAPPAFLFSSANTTYILSSQGTAVAKSSDLPQISKLPTIVDQSGFNATAGQQVLTASSVGFIQALVAECQHNSIPISSLALPARAQELDLRTSDRSYYVKFFLGSDSLTQIGQFLASRHQFDSSNSQPSEYLDVRVQGKVFYR